ncbi:MAG TPA: glycosyltransferase [Burkholderiaceae bacterium]|nr:glycosyltransferase [Burkholderiaceae bacterium]
MLKLLLTFLLSMLGTLLIIRSAHRHEHLTADGDLDGPQKFHSKPVPRIGGLGPFVAMAVTAFYAWWSGLPFGRDAALLIACSFPAFAAGLVEDLTKRVSPGIRLLATAIAAALAFFVLDARISHTDLPGLDWFVGLSAGAFVATVFTVAGVANSVNIIDGFNGLSSMCVVLMLSAFAFVGFEVGDVQIATLALLGVTGIAGFFVWNYPAGLIFLGDGGAYFFGFYVAEVGILLISRHPEVAPLFALTVCIYPVFETVFSIYRRRFVRAVPPGLPDGIHLHSLIYRRVMRWALGAADARALTRRNSMTAPYLWVLCTFSLVPSLLFWNSTPGLVISIAGFSLIYIGLYRRIVRFRTPKWMVLRQPDDASVTERLER